MSETALRQTPLERKGPGGTAVFENGVRYTQKLGANPACAANRGVRNLLKRTADPDSIKRQPFETGASGDGAGWKLLLAQGLYVGSQLGCIGCADTLGGKSVRSLLLRSAVLDEIGKIGARSLLHFVG